MHKAFELRQYKIICEAIYDGTIDAIGCLTPNAGTILHIAAFYGDFSVIWVVPTEILMQIDNNGDTHTPLIIASREGHLHFVDDLIYTVKSRVTASVEEQGGSALQPFQKLLKVANLQGNTALHEAV